MRVVHHGKIRTALRESVCHKGRGQGSSEQKKGGPLGSVRGDFWAVICRFAAPNGMSPEGYVTTPSEWQMTVYTAQPWTAQAIASCTLTSVLLLLLAADVTAAFSCLG